MTDCFTPIKHGYYKLILSFNNEKYCVNLYSVNLNMAILNHALLYVRRIQL